MALEYNIKSRYILEEGKNHAYTCKNQCNTGEIEGDDIYFPLYDFASKTILPRKLKFTYSEFQTLPIFIHYDPTTNTLKRWFYNMVNRHSNKNKIIQPMYHNVRGNDITLTTILRNYTSRREEVVCFRNGIKFDYTTGNYYTMLISEYNKLATKPVSLLSVDN